MTPLNPLVRDTGSPPIPEAQGWARRYDGSRGPLIDLSQAVPGYPPHEEILSHLGEAAGTLSAARYGDIFGDDALRTALAADITTRYRGTVSAANILVTSGCNQAFVLAAMTLAKAGENIILPAPWYFNHQMTLDMLGIEPRALTCKAANAFIPVVEDARALIDEKTRALVLVTPNNPTGAIYPREVIAAFAKLAKEKQIWLVIDETYRDFLNADYGTPHDLFASDDWDDTVISLYSFSKAYCVPGHRVGAIVGGRGLLDEVSKVIDCVQICAPRAAQQALSWAIPNMTEWRAANTIEIEHRAKAFISAMAGSEGWRLDSIGAYFAYVAHPFTDIPVKLVAQKLAEERGILALPGPYFGPHQETHLRFAFANVDRHAIETLPLRFKGFRS